MDSKTFLETVGARVRARREALGLTQKELSRRAGLSVRFLAQLEHGDGNISVRRLAEVVEALGMTLVGLFGDAEPPARPVRHVALLGLRGAGKSTIGKRVAQRLGMPFVELDDLVAQAAGLSLAEIFELHGEVYYRRLARDTLKKFLSEGPGAVIATGGSIVNDRDAFRLLRERAMTIWLRARAEDHWNRVVDQGDRRPMAQSRNAYVELRALLRAREPLYATADHTVDTTAGVASAVEAVLRAVGK